MQRRERKSTNSRKFTDYCVLSYISQDKKLAKNQVIRKWYCIISQFHQSQICKCTFQLPACSFQQLSSSDKHQSLVCLSSNDLVLRSYQSQYRELQVYVSLSLLFFKIFIYNFHVDGNISFCIWFALGYFFAMCSSFGDFHRTNLEIKSKVELKLASFLFSRVVHLNHDSSWLAVTPRPMMSWLASLENRRQSR